MKPEKALTLFLNSKKGAKASTTVTWYASKLHPLIDYLTEQGITHIETTKIFDLEAWRGSLTASDLAPATLRGYIRVARTFFKWLAQRQIIKSDIGADLELPPRVRIRKDGISEYDRDRLIAAASGNPRDHAILLFLADTACRLAGIASLTIDRLYLDEHRAYVTEKGLGGLGKGRSVFYGDNTALALDIWLTNRPNVTDPHLFLGYKRGGRVNQPGWRALSEQGIYQMIRRYADKIDIELNWNPHAWRHGAARSMTKRGLPLQTLAQILGHSSVQVTADIYGLLDDETLQQMHEIYSPLKARADILPQHVDS